MPSRLATSPATDCRSAMAVMAILRVVTVILRGRPPFRPRARAAAKPARVRSAISSRSNSASDAKIPKHKRPFVVVINLRSAAAQHLEIMVQRHWIQSSEQGGRLTGTTT